MDSSLLPPACAPCLFVSVDRGGASQIPCSVPLVVFRELQGLQWKNPCNPYYRARYICENTIQDCSHFVFVTRVITKFFSKWTNARSEGLFIIHIDMKFFEIIFTCFRYILKFFFSFYYVLSIFWFRGVFRETLICQLDCVLICINFILVFQERLSLNSVYSSSLDVS